MSDYGDQSAAAGDVFFKVSMKNARAKNCTDVENIYCVGCGMEIPEPRREAMPGCIYCVECQQIDEQKGG